jgi:hypothetical protein
VVLRFGSLYGQEFLLLHIIQTSYGTHPASYSKCTGDPFSGGNEDDHSSPNSSEVMNTGIYISITPFIFVKVLNYLQTGTNFFCTFHSTINCKMVARWMHFV